MSELRTVLLKFSGPLQSWGTDSHFESRHTDTHPSKSGVIGLIAAGLGYSRDDDTEIQRLNSLFFAVRVDQRGELLRDFHTAQKFKENGDFERNYVTNRYYLQDAVFVVGLGSNDDSLIQDVVCAVTHPYYSLFLGRRSLPPTADLLLGLKKGDPVSVLSDYPWQASGWYRKQNSGRKILEIYSDATGAPCTKSHFRNDLVKSFSQNNGRKFDTRLEVESWIDVNAICSGGNDPNEFHEEG